MKRSTWAAVAASVCFAACSDSNGSTDAGTLDARAEDAIVAPQDAEPDASEPDAQTPDATELDAEPEDTGTPDMGIMVPAEFTSGTRLRALMLETSDGARQFISWFDLDRNERCSFVIASDGMRRCLPESQTVGFEGFLDDMCTQRIWVIPMSMCTGPTTSVLRSQQVDGCNRPVTVRPIDQPVMPPPAMIYTRDFTGTCRGGAPDPTDDLRVIGDPIAPASFVAAEIQQESGAGRLVATRLIADDGAMRRFGWYDRTESLPCQGALSIDGSRRCLPAQGAYYPANVWYTDSSCMSEGAIGFDSDCDPTSPYAFAFTEMMCLSAAQLYVRGPEVMPGYSSPEPGMCFPADVGAFGGHIYALGPEVDPAVFAAFAAGTDGTTRLRMKQDVTADGITLRSGDWYDSMRGEDCSFDRAADGMFRCLPNALVETFFTDPNCTMEVAGTTTTAGCAPEVSYLKTYRYQSCQLLGRMRMLGAPVMPAELYKGGPGACDPATTSANAFYEIGAEVPPQSFQAATEVME